MNDESDYTLCCLSAISNFTFDLSKTDLFQFVLQKLESSSLEELPIIIKFLLQCGTEENSSSIVKEMRIRLDFKSLSLLESTDTKEKKQHEVLAFDSLRVGITSNQYICNSFLKEITSLSEKKDHLLIDIWVLFILYSFQTFSLKSEKIIKKKISLGLFDEKLLAESLEGHEDALYQYFPFILNISGSFLKNSNIILQKAGIILYENLFINFTSDFYRKKLLASLISHIGSSNKIEINASLEILLYLSQKSLKSLRSFSSFLQGTLDYLESLSEDQIRKVYEILAILSYTKSVEDIRNSQSVVLQNDLLSITVFKELNNGSLKYLKMGLIGVSMIIGYVGSFTKEYRERLRISEDQTLESEEYRNLVELLNVSIRSCFKVPIAISFLFDEISSVIKGRRISEKYLKFIEEKFYESFQKDYLFLLKSSNLENEFKNIKFKDVKPELWMDLSTGSDEKIVIPVFPLLYSKMSFEKLWTMISMFKLMSILIPDGVDLIGTPIVMFSEDNLKGFHSLQKIEKDQLCLSLFFSINWFRELINTFGKNKTYRNLLIERLKNLITLERRLDECLFLNEGFILPQLDLPLNKEDSVFEIPKKKKEDKKKEEDDDDPIEEEEDKKKKTKSKGYDRSIKLKYLSKLKYYFRELDMNMIDILKMPQGDVFESSAYYYILYDLLDKIKIISKRNTSSPFGSNDKISHSNLDKIDTNEFMKQIIDLFPLFISFIEQLTKLITDENLEKDELNEYYYDPCLITIFEIIDKVLTFLISTNQIEKIKEVLLNFKNQEMDTFDPFKLSFNYFKKYLDILGIESSMKLLNILILILKNVDKGELHKELSEISFNILKKDYRHLKGDNILQIINISIDNSLKPHVQMENILSQVISFLDSEDKTHPDFPTLNKSSFIYFFKALILQSTNLLLQFDQKEKEDKKVIKESLNLIQNCVIVFKILIESTTKHNPSNIQMLIIRIGKKFVFNFLKVMNYFPKIFKSFQKTITDILKDLQSSTRILQMICANGKVFKNPTIKKCIPILKRDLEKILYKVKILCKDNLEGFKLRTLKNKTMDGKEVKDEDDIYKKLSKNEEEEMEEE